MNLEEVKATVHELRVHQIELELQNEELRRIQTQLEKARSRYSVLYNSAPVGYLALNRSGVIVHYNRTFMDMIGSSDGELPGKPFTDIVAHEDKNQFLARYRAFFAQPEGKAMDIRLAGRDGRIFFARLQGRLEELEAAGSDETQQKMLLLVATDITEQRTSKMELESQTRFLKTLLSAIPSPVFYKDRSGRYLGCNEAFEELVGKPGDLIVGQTVNDLWPDEYGAAIFRNDLELLKSPGRQRYEHLVPAADGGLRNMVFYKSTFSDTGGKLAGIVGVLLDVSDRKKTEEELRRKSNIDLAMAEMARTLSYRRIHRGYFPIDFEKKPGN